MNINQLIKQILLTRKRVPFYITGSEDTGYEITVFVEYLNPSDVSSVSIFLDYFFTTPPSEAQPDYIKMVFKVPIGQGNIFTYIVNHVDFYNKTGIEQTQTFVRECNMFAHANFALGFLNAIPDIDLKRDLKNYLLFFAEQINHALKKQFDVSEEEVQDLLHIMNHMDLVAQDNVVLEAYLPFMLELLIRSNQLPLISKIWDENRYKKIIMQSAHYIPYLQQALCANSKPEDFSRLMEIINNTYNLVDQFGNSLFHYVTGAYSELLEMIYLMDSNLNKQNPKGSTPLHATAWCSDVKKANFLLVNGADPDIKNLTGETFWTLKSDDQKGSLFHYRQFHQQGKVLKFPPIIAKQKGVSCGLYAAVCIRDYYYSWQPHLFNKNLMTIPARKGDTNPKTAVSLRQISKQLGLTQLGEIFSANDLAKVINETGCAANIIDIQNYNQFMHHIKSAIDTNAPIIVPFAVSKTGEASIDGNPNFAHWATIIGYTNEVNPRVLLAEYGEYVPCDLQALFLAFFNMGEIFPKTDFVKSENMGWITPDKHNGKDTVIDKVTIPQVSLEGFRRKLIVVTPLQLVSENSNTHSMKN